MTARLCIWILIGASIGTIGCKKLNQGYCDSNDQCPSRNCSNYVCMDVGGTTGAAGASGAAGAGGAAGGGGAAGAGGKAGSGGAGGEAFTCAHAKCGGTTPICDLDAGSCVGCNEVHGSCGSPDGGTPFCLVDAGPMNGMCVACITDKECKGATPICELGGDAGASRYACGPCTSSSECTQVSPTTPVCVTATNITGVAQLGTCVGCVANTDCTSANGASTTPICELTTTNASTPANTCRKCAQDTECGGPGVCMTDGHCASEDETIYVLNDMAATTPTCNDSPAASDGGANAGTKAHPLCSMQPILSFASANRDLVLLDGSGGIITGGTWSYADQAKAQLSIVGQQTATVGSVSTPAFSMQSGNVYIRGVIFSRSGSIGIKATGGNLTLNSVTVDNCGGGGLVLSGTTFDIESTTVTNNGPGPSGTSGGINITAAGSGSKLNLVTVEGNTPIGVACDNTIAATGAYVMSNSGTQIANNCNFTSCTKLGSGCGAP